MFLTLFSVIFLLLVSLAKIYLSKVLPTDDYAAFTAALGLAALCGSIFFGAYPKLYPGKVKELKFISLDLLSIFSCVGLITFGWFHFNVKILCLMVCFMLFYAFHESSSIIYSLLSSGKKLMLIEFSHSLIFILFIFFSFFYSINISAIALFAFPVIIFLLYLLVNDGFKFKVDLNLSQAFVNDKYIVLVSAASVFLIPFLFYNFFDSGKASSMIAFFYIFSIPIAFNQVLINRFLYRVRVSLFRSSLTVFFVVAVQSVFFYWFNSTEYYIELIKFLTPYSLNVLFIPLFMFMFSRAFFSVVFIETRFKKLPLRFSFLIECIKVVLTVVSVWLTAIYAGDDEVLSIFFIFFSISYLISAIFYLVGIRLDK
ncbi:hypothetical protein C8J23_12089 [Shewanella chilikensis]|uniref:Oligosaccharide flippase family protein n=1 Tax=Shewanella chilikensis TaxID=558541 RepID=A0ABX5PM10_9GAMM|nr:hypothetical protein [Shewanella chilikensis]MCL1152652.1 hypothetical protein [Shewanella chilikensis]PYE57637.1 hypothetical protein C8J23_12089 [Shewanella chilikensis]GGZ40834.1 hypothetical protein GCM10007105_29770 [Shewanella chilikensis]